MSLLNSINYLRFDQSFDYSKVPIIRNDHTIELDPKIAPNNWIDELRITNFMKNPPEPRRIPEIDMLEYERFKKYGMKVDVSSSTIAQRLSKLVMKVPQRDPNGNIIPDPTTGNPIMRNMTFRELLDDPLSMQYRVEQLINNIESVPNVLRDLGTEYGSLMAGLDANTQNFRQIMIQQLQAIYQHLFLSSFKDSPTVNKMKENASRKVPIFDGLSDAQKKNFISKNDMIEKLYKKAYVDNQDTMRDVERRINDGSLRLSSDDLLATPETMDRNTRRVYFAIQKKVNYEYPILTFYAFQIFIRIHFTDILQIQMNDAINIFIETGGVEYYLSQTEAKTGTVPIHRSVGPTGPPISSTLSDEEQRRKLEEILKKEEEAKIKKDEKKEEKKEEFIDDPSLLIDESNIALRFDKEGIQAERMMGQAWYMKNIQTKSRSPNDPNYGKLDKFRALIATLHLPKFNEDYISFNEYGDDSPQKINKGRPYSSATIAKHIFDGKAIINLLSNTKATLLKNV